MKTLWPKQKLLIMSNFTFGHNVFKSRLLLLRQNAEKVGKGFNIHLILDSHCFSVSDFLFMKVISPVDT